MTATRHRLRFLAIVALSVAFAWVLVRSLQFSVFNLARVSNESMLPYLKPGQVILINKLAPCFKVPFSRIRLACSPCEAGRAYIFSNPARPGQKLVKFATVLQPTLKRDIIWFTHSTPVEAQSTSAASCYFEGSNREYSVDSRHFGPVPLTEVDGKVMLPVIRWDYTQAAPARGREP